MRVSTSSQRVLRDKLRDLTHPRRCFMPIDRMIGEINAWLGSWSNYFDYGYPRAAFRALNRFAQERLQTHLQRRSQRPMHAGRPFVRCRAPHAVVNARRRRNVTPHERRRASRLRRFNGGHVTASSGDTWKWDRRGKRLR